MTEDEEYRKDRATVSAMQSATIHAVRKVSSDSALMSYALFQLAIKLSIAMRLPDRSKLDHRDWLTEQLHEIHRRSWDDTGVQILYDLMQKDKL